jgi:hypothetical protein
MSGVESAFASIERIREVAAASARHGTRRYDPSFGPDDRAKPDDRATPDDRPGPGDRPRLDDRLQGVYDASREVASGRDFLGASDSRRKWAAEVPPEGGRYLVFGHGKPDHFTAGTTELSAPELATLIRHDPRWNGQEVRLMSCLTGQTRDSFGQTLADELGVDVLAPSDDLWAGRNGRYVVSSATTDPNFGIEVARMPPDGMFRHFSPRTKEAP